MTSNNIDLDAIWKNAVESLLLDPDAERELTKDTDSGTLVRIADKYLTEAVKDMGYTREQVHGMLSVKDVIDAARQHSSAKHQQQSRYTLTISIIHEAEPNVFTVSGTLLAQIRDLYKSSKVLEFTDADGRHCLIPPAAITKIIAEPK